MYDPGQERGMEVSGPRCTSPECISPRHKSGYNDTCPERVGEMGWYVKLAIASSQ